MNRSHIITYLILGSRLFLFAVFQVLIYLVFLLRDSSNPWHKAEGCWTFSVIFTIIISILIIISLFGKGGNNISKYLALPGKVGGKI
jgi:hypothetical protein